MEERLVLHILVDELPDDELVPAKRFLEYLRFRNKDPLRAFLDEAPLDDEAVTGEDLAAIREGLAEKAGAKPSDRRSHTVGDRCR